MAFTVIATTGKVVSAYPATLDLSSWSTYRVQLTETGSTGVYNTWDLHRGHGLTWLIFVEDTTAQPSAKSDKQESIFLSPTNGYCDITRDTPYGIQVPRKQDGSTTPTDLALPFNWALLNQTIVDPADRYTFGGTSVPGGQWGCFDIWVPACGRESATANDQEAEVWEVQSTIQVPIYYGGSVIKGGGKGYGRYLNQAFGHSGASCKLYWNPTGLDSDIPMFLVRGNSYIFDGFSLLGSVSQNPTNSEVTKKEVCIVHARLDEAGHPYAGRDIGGVGGTTSTTAIATSGITWRNCTFDSWDVCIWNGPGNENNTDLMYCENIRCNNVGTFWKNSNALGMVHHFRNIHGNVTDYWFQFIGGGKAVIEDVVSFTAGAEILHIGDGTDWTTTLIGANNAEFTLKNCGFDSQATGGVLVGMDTPSGVAGCCVINVIGGSDSAATSALNTAFMNIQGSTNLNLTNYRYMGKITCTQVTNNNDIVGRPYINIDDCTYFKGAEETNAEATLLAGDYELGRFNVTQTSSNGAEGTVTPRPAESSLQREWTQTEIETLSQAKYYELSAAGEVEAGAPRVL